jgi:hypothetical protein
MRQAIQFRTRQKHQKQVDLLQWNGDVEAGTFSVSATGARASSWHVLAGMLKSNRTNGRTS